MTVQDLLDNLSKQDGSKLFTATFYPLFEHKPLTIFNTADAYGYQEIFANDCTIGNEIEPITIAEAIEQLKQECSTEGYETPIILTIGSEEDDLVSSMGGVEFVDGELFLNTETCPRQA